MVDKIRQNLDVTEETPKAEPKSPQTETSPESQETADLFRGFSMETLLDSSHKAFYEVKSKDLELGCSQNIFSLHEKNTSHIPEDLRSLPQEGKVMFDFLRKPSTDLRQIQQRQVLVESFVNAPDIEQLTVLKNGSYKFTYGIRTLFAPIYVDEYNQMPALYAYRNGYAEIASSTVFKGLSLLEEGQAALGQLAGIMAETQSPFIKELSKIVADLSVSTEPFTRKYFLEDNYDESYAGSSANNCETEIRNIGMFMEFANLAKRDSYSKCEFDETKPFEYREGWNFFRRKLGRAKQQHREQDQPPQVTNNSPRHTPVTVYNGSNMSGKSFQMKTGFFMQLCSQAFGYSPCAEGNFGIYDSFHYLDRASTSHAINLSAFGKEVQDWNQTAESFGKRPFVCCDEGFSTTSPEDQYVLLSAADLFLRERNARVFYANHNEDFVKRHANDQNVGLYHLKIEVAENGAVQYHYCLCEGIDDSRALDIGKALGLHPELINLAAAYLRSEGINIDGCTKRTGKKVECYSEEDRQRLKQKTGELPKHQGRQCQIFSEDPDFQSMSWSSRLYIKDTYKLSSAGTRNKLLEAMDDYRASRLYHLVFERLSDLDSREVLERQRTFEALSSCDRYPELLELERDLAYLMVFLPGLNRVADRFLRFNLALHPFGTDRAAPRDGCNRYQNKDIFISYLEFNEKLLGDNFLFKKEFEEFKALSRLCDLMDELMMDRDIDEIIAAQETELDAEISNEHVVAVFRALIGEGRVTVRAINDYLHRERCNIIGRDDENINLLRDAAADYTELGNLLKDRRESIRRDFRKLRDILGDVDSREQQGRITMRHILMLKKRFEQNQHQLSYNDYEACDNIIRNLLRIFDQEQEHFDFSKGGGIGLTPASVRGAVVQKMQDLDELVDTLPARSLFDCDLDEIRPYLAPLISHYLAKLDNRFGYGGEIDLDDNDLNFAMCFAFVADAENKIQKYLDLLRSFDSVDCHQFANSLERSFRCFMTVGENWRFKQSRSYGGEISAQEILDYEWKHNREKWVLVCGKDVAEKVEMDLKRGETASYNNLVRKHSLSTGPQLFAALRAFYDNKMAEVQRELNVLENEQAGIAVKCPWFFSFHSGQSPADCQKIVAACEKSPRLERFDVRNFIEYFEKFKRRGEYVNYFSSNSKVLYRSYIDRLDLESKESPQRVLEDFIENEVKGSEELRQMQEIVAASTALGEKAEQFRQKYKIEFQYAKYDDYHGSRLVRDTHAYEALKWGDLGPLRKVIRNTFRTKVSSAIDFLSGDGVQRMRASLAEVSTHFMIGHMINRQHQAKVCFNEDGRIDLRNAWSLFYNKDQQVRNDFVFEGDERLKLLASPNMSGKTFALKALFTAVAWALATGYAPADSANMPVVDKAIYLDRVMSKNDRNLSAFGNEAQFWVELFKIFETGNVFAVGALDEIFSTTSPKYQAALTYAVGALGFLKMGQCGVLASHNHDAVEALLAQFPDRIKGHHFSWREGQKEGQTEFIPEYKMQPGNKRSHAIEIARHLGLHSKILEYAEMVKAGNICP